MLFRSATLLSGSAAIASLLGSSVVFQAIWSIPITASFVTLVPAAKWATKYRLGAVVAKIGEGSIVYYCTHFIMLMIAFNLLERTGLVHPGILAGILIPVVIASAWSLDRARQLPAIELMFTLRRPTRHSKNPLAA